MSGTLQKCLTKVEAADASQTSKSCPQQQQSHHAGTQHQPQTVPNTFAKTLQVIAGSGTDLDEPQSSRPPDQHPPSGSDVSMEATPPAKRRVHIIIPEAVSSKQQSAGGPGMRNKPPRCRPAVLGCRGERQPGRCWGRTVSLLQLLGERMAAQMSGVLVLALFCVLVKPKVAVARRL